MAMEPTNEQQVIRFLLGDLPEQQRVILEERIFKEDAFYKQVLAIQEELADDYIRDNLSDKQRERLAFGTAIASLVLLIGVVWLVVENGQLSAEISQILIEKESVLTRANNDGVDSAKREQALEKEIAALRVHGAEMEKTIQQKQSELEELRRVRHTQRLTRNQGIAAFVLPPGLTRGTDEPEKLVIPLATRVVQLQLDLESEEKFQSYVAEIRTARGNIVWGKSDLRMQRTGYGSAVSLHIPANLLSTGEYELVLKGAARGRLEAVAYYYFIALRR